MKRERKSFLEASCSVRDGQDRCIILHLMKSSRIRIVHSTNSRRQSLNLDIADIFKPIIVDRTIFTLINKHMLDVKNDFQSVENGGVYLSRSGKRVFINHLDRKVYDKFTDNGVVKSYDSKIRDEVNKIFRLVTYGEKYKPYKYY